jgi:hypothetical protein
MVDDEFLLLMAHCPGRSEGTDNIYILTIPDRQRLRAIGLKTVHEQPPWWSMEPSKGDYDFTVLDDIIYKNRAADMKSLLYVCGWTFPSWMPNEWFPRNKNGTYDRHVLSLWNEEAQQYSDKHYKMLYNKYSDPDIMWVFGEFQGGEGAYPPTWALYDDAAIQDYKKTYGTSAMPEPLNPDTMDWFGKKIIQHFVRKSKILYPRYKEVWNMQQYLMNTDTQFGTKAFGNFVHLDILKKYRKLWPDGSIVLLQATYYDSSHGPDNVVFVDMLRTTINCEVIVEAMFCAGLPMTTPKAISQGFRGQVVMPAFEGGATHLEEWMVNNIRVSNEQWRRSKGL